MADYILDDGPELELLVTPRKRRETRNKFDTSKPGRWVTLRDGDRVYIEDDPEPVTRYGEWTVDGFKWVDGRQPLSVAEAEADDSPAWEAEVETVYIDLPNGTHISIKGVEDRVAIPVGVIARDGVLTHNHPPLEELRDPEFGNLIRHASPGGSTLSEGDFATSKRLDLKEIRAFGEDWQGRRWLYSAKRPKDGWSEVGSVFIPELRRKSRDLITKQQAKMLLVEGDDRRAIIESIDEARHNLMVELTRKYGIDYSRKRIK